MRARNIIIATVAAVAATSAGVAIADNGRDLPDMPLWSYDVGDNAPRVIGWCFGADAIYQANESDGIAVAAASPNCAEGGLLTREGS